MSAESPTIRRNAVWALLAEGSRAIFAAALILFATRALGPEEFGLFALALSVAGIALLPADFGVSSSAGRFIAEHRGEQGAMAAVVSDSLRVKLVISGGVALLLAVLAGPVSEAYGEPALAAPLRWTAVALFAQSVFTLFATVFMSIGRVSLQALLFAGESIAELALVVGAVILAGGAAAATAGRAAAFVLGALLGVVLTLRLLGRGISPLVRTGEGPGRRLLGYAGALFVVDAAFILFASADVLLIGALLTTEDVGQFSAAMRLTILFTLAGTAATSAIAPRVARHASEPQATGALLAGLRMLTIIGALAAGVLLAWADPVVDLLLGPDYEESAEVIRALSPYIILAVIGPLATRSVDYVGMGARRIPPVLAALAVNVVIDLLLLEEIGIVAGAIGTGVAYAIYCPIHIYYLRQALGLDVRAILSTTVRALLAAAACAGVLALIGTDDLGVLQWALGIVAGPAAFLAVLVATRELTVAQLRSAPAALRGLRG